MPLRGERDVLLRERRGRDFCSNAVFLRNRRFHGLLPPPRAGGQLCSDSSKQPVHWSAGDLEFLCPRNQTRVAPCAGDHSFPRRLLLNFSTLVRTTSERSNVFAQRKGATGMGVELVKCWLRLIQTNSSGDSQRLSLSHRAPEALCCGAPGSQAHGAKLPAGVQCSRSQIRSCALGSLSEPRRHERRSAQTCGCCRSSRDDESIACPCQSENWKDETSQG